ncbi:unnamed protein product [Pleuronectes platessa]|uniref:Uncharacterized protein n=1 Tax=Pleuronectes platessa TaxID=8262 RepID=A0A9N7Z9I1_PLEPL|nr:unnamed protein product [Pleuronectes platessa]
MHTHKRSPPHCHHLWSTTKRISCPPLHRPVIFFKGQSNTVLSGIQGTGSSLVMQVQEIWFQRVYGTVVAARICFKTLILGYLAAKGSGPAYIQDIVKPFSLSTQLCIHQSACCSLTPSP